MSIFGLPSLKSALAPLQAIVTNLHKVQAAHKAAADEKAEYAVELLQQVDDHDKEAKAALKQAAKIEDLLN